jgi:predicted dehydrogenase
MAGCRVRGECPFDCERFYLAVGPNYWHTLTEDQTEDGVRRALRDGRYGRCVFACDNDVADHQLVNIRFAGGATAELIMSGLSSKSRRSLQVTCTKGEIYGILETGRLTVAPFGREPRVIDLATGGQAACRGGDSGLISEFVRYISGQPYDTLSMTGIDASLASHQIAFAAEESRLSGATVHNA